MVVSQDAVRRDMLKVNDVDGNLSIELIKQIAEYGNGKCEVIIVEGILNTYRYKEMLEELIASFEGNAYSFYFDLSFEETVQRHHSRSKKNDFGEDSLRRWWNAHDYLDEHTDIRVTDEMSQEDILALILRTI
ncbi:hypothetical protein DH09_11775 [Bacillaceae bacterium JMAK1]|nr:hypothetical protein DH09_11775 [Bacillaceae bacterium JMAK1]